MNNFKFTSNQIADLTNRGHDKVLRTIRKELNKNPSSFNKHNFKDGKYVDKCNSTRPSIYMNELGLEEYCKLKNLDVKSIISKIVDSKVNIKQIEFEVDDITLNEALEELLRLVYENEKLVKEIDKIKSQMNYIFKYIKGKRKIM